MPIYDYKCRECNYEFAVFYLTQGAVKREEKDEKCPRCSTTKKKRTVSKSTSHILKGKGWYRDGY